MSNLIDDLLNYARASTGEQKPEVLELVEILAEVRAELGPDLEASGVLLTSDPLPSVLGDRWQLGRLLVHLVDNAIRYRVDDRAQPSVHVGLTRREREWVVSVRDNGRGIESHEIPRLFTILGRSHPEEGEGGTGVGLALCRRVVERHGGHIWIDSVVGEGATVSFTLPVLDDEEAPEA
jgi:signal transduction histidine kinase